MLALVLADVLGTALLGHHEIVTVWHKLRGLVSGDPGHEIWRESTDSYVVDVHGRIGKPDAITGSSDDGEHERCGRMAICRLDADQIATLERRRLGVDRYGRHDNDSDEE